MKLLILSVRDSAVGAFMNPFAMASKGVAIRSFTDEVNKSASPMYSHPEDYELYVLGTFEDTTGAVEPWTDGPALVVRAKDVIIKGEK